MPLNKPSVSPQSQIQKTAVEVKFTEWRLGGKSGMSKDKESKISKDRICWITPFSRKEVTNIFRKHDRIFRILLAMILTIQNCHKQWMKVFLIQSHKIYGVSVMKSRIQILLEKWQIHGQASPATFRNYYSELKKKLNELILSIYSFICNLNCILGW